ncbi:MAG: c-type cytochrome [Woeseia sp.]
MTKGVENRLRHIALCTTAATLAIWLAACQDRPVEDEQNREQTGQDGSQPAPKADMPLGTFRTDATRAAATEDGGRLPAPGDDTIYVPATDLFPGSARLDPNIENPYSGNEQAIAAGERHFAAFNCGGCHAPLGGGGMGPPLSDDAWIYGSEPAQVYLSIMHGRPEGMPAWSSMLPRRAVWELVAYIETLSQIDDYAAEKGFNRARSPASGQEQDGSDGARPRSNGAGTTSAQEDR